MQVNLFWVVLLPLIGGSTMVFVVYLVMQEKHEHEDYYIPPQSSPRSERPADPDAMMTAEITGTQQLSASPIIDEEAKRHAEEERE